MRVTYGSATLLGVTPSAAAIGVFDGVHRGHQALLQRAHACAVKDSLECVAYTFDPHPLTFLRPERAPALIEPLTLRLEHFAPFGVERAVVETFDASLAAMTPEEFVADVLVGRLGVRHVVVGADFTFGARRAGTVTVLHELGNAHGFQVHPIGAVLIDGERVSSTRVRTSVRAGDMTTATQLLGRPFVLRGRVIHGDGRGRGLGFPTANLDTQNVLIPSTGVYAARATGPFGERGAVVNIGFNPTFEGETLKVEAHLFDYERDDLYDATLDVALTQKLRDERAFEGVEALKTQIARDAAAARAALAAG